MARGHAAVLFVALLAACEARADFGLSVVPPWRAAAARQFTVKDGRILADGVPFPLIMDFTWSAPPDDAFLRFAVQLLDTANYRNVSIRLEGPQDWMYLDSVVEQCRRSRIYLVVGLSVADQDGYLSRHPEAAMLGPGGAKMHRSYVCFMDPGYRQALGKALAELAQHLRDKPWVLGYYPQDEFSYPGLGGYSPASLKAFRESAVKKYGGLDALNRAWKTEFRGQDDIQPPAKLEATARWADWQEFRRWAYFDFAGFVYRALKDNDPNHLVIWSLDFWGSPESATNWWRMPQCSDVLMRHGIAYQGGTFRFQFVREIAEWSGKPGSALAMPPGYYPSFEQFSLILDASRNGLSYVCPGGGDDHLHYRGAGDSDRGYARREPGYTTSRSFNQLVYDLGETFLASRRRPPQVGLLVGDRTSWIVGIGIDRVTGLLNLLGDLNLDFEVVSEHNMGDLTRFKALIAGQPFQLASNETASRIETYVRDGGALVLMPGAFEADENGVPAQREVFAPFEAAAAAAKEIRIGEHGFPLDRRTPLRPLRPAVQGRVAAVSDAGAVAAGVIAVGKGEILALGWDAGTLYQSGWSRDFAGVSEKDNPDVIAENAYANMAPARAAEGSVALQPQRAVAVLVRDFVRGRGAREAVRCAGYEDAVSALRARSFRQGDHYLVGVANRMVRPGKKFEREWPADYHVVQKDLEVRLLLDRPADRLLAVQMPLARPDGDGWTAMPRMLTVQTAAAGEARFTLPRLEDAAMVVVSPGFRPVLGVAASQRRLVAGEALKLTSRVVNAGVAAVRGILFAEADATGLRVVGPETKVEVAPGGQFEAIHDVQAPADAAQGYYLAHAALRLDDGRVFRSPSLEVEVIPAWEVSLRPAGLTLYPQLQDSRDLTVALRPARRSARGKAVISLDGAAAFQPDARSRTIEVDGSKDEYTAAFAFRPPAQPHHTETADVSAQGEVGGARLAQSWPVRLAQGAVAYREKKKVQLTNSRPEAEVVEMVVLENTRIKARLIPQTAVVHDLVLRETNQDMLLESMYPFGLVWYQWRAAWRLKGVTPAGPEVRAEFESAAPNGKPVTMTATLREGDSHLTVAYDASESGPVACPFYLMSRLGRGGTHVGNVMHVPTRRTVLQRPWDKGRAFVDVAAADLAEPWLAIADSINGQVFSVSFAFDSLKSVQVSSGQSGFNYMIFNPDPDKPPGRIVFRLAAQKGGMDEALALQRPLIQAGGKP